MGQLLSTVTQAGAGFHQTVVPDDEFQELFNAEAPPTAFVNTLASRRFVRTTSTDDMDMFLGEFSRDLTRYLEDRLREFHTMRASVLLYPTYEKVAPLVIKSGVPPPAPITPVLRTKLLTILRARVIPSTVHTILETLRSRHVNFMRDSSGLRMLGIQKADVHIASVRHMTYEGRVYSPLPPFLAKKKAIVNVHNTDARCFGYALLSALHQSAYHQERPTQYSRYFAEHAELNGLEYPVQVDQFEDVERQIGIAFNVFTFYDDDGRARYPLYLSKINVDEAIDLLFWNGHYAWIKSFTRFLGDQNSNGHTRYFCKRCLGRFTQEHTLATHQQFCMAMDGCKQIYTMPREGDKLVFKNVKFQARFPFVVYADFEALTVPCTRTDRDTELANCCQSHKPISVGLKLVSSAPGVLDDVEYETFTGDNVAKWFLERLLAYREMVFEYLFDDRRLLMTQADYEDFNRATQCYVCQNPFPVDGDRHVRPGSQKVRDHDHLTGAYRGAAHSYCNLKLRKTYAIPVFLHNFRGYDSHLIVPAFTEYKGMSLEVIGQGLEKYLTLTWDKTIVFKDSLQFLSSRLDTLVACLLKSGKDKFKVLRAEFPDVVDDAVFDKLLRNE
jgi:hypothetical protein